MWGYASVQMHVTLNLYWGLSMVILCATISAFSRNHWQMGGHS
jgi:hypothetical protein